MTEQTEVTQSTSKPKKKQVTRKKKLKKKRQEERLAGLILLIITMFIGFVLWVSGEMKNKNVYNSGVDIGGNQDNQETIIIK